MDATLQPPSGEDARRRAENMHSARVGVLGGGQLGRMMAEAAHRLGVQLTVLDPDGLESPAGAAH